MADPSRPASRVERGLASAGRWRSAAWDRARNAVANPMRLLGVVVAAVLLVLSLPLLVGSATRLARDWRDWRHENAVTDHWETAVATIRGVRVGDGLDLDLTFWDERGLRHTTDVHLDRPGSGWVRSTLPVRYDPADPSQVDVVGFDHDHPVGRALTTGAALGAGIAAAMLGIAIWRRRATLAFADRPLRVLRAPLARSGAVLLVGVAAWVVGTVTTEGWTSVADSIGDEASSFFGGFMMILLPVVAFGLGALVAAWLAEHRHHEAHHGMLSSAHRLIDRASDYMPSPDQIRAAPTDEPTDRPGDAPEVAPDAGDQVSGMSDVMQKG